VARRAQPLEAIEQQVEALLEVVHAVVPPGDDLF
jgi:hypothetical protein